MLLDTAWRNVRRDLRSQKTFAQMFIKLGQLFLIYIQINRNSAKSAQVRKNKWMRASDNITNFMAYSMHHSLLGRAICILK